MAARLDTTWFGSSLILAATAALIGVTAGIRPELAIVAALAIAFALLVVTDIAAGVALFTLFTFFELLPGISGPALSFTKLAGLALALSWLATLATRREAANLDFFRGHPGIGWVLAMFLAWVGLSFFWAEAQTNAAEALYRFTLNVVLFLIVFTAIRSREDAIRVFAAFVIGATAAAIYGFVFANAQVVPYGEAARLKSTTQNADELASILVATLALCGGLIMVLNRSPLLRLATIAAAAIAMTGIFLTVSRAGMIALGVALVAAIVFGGRWRARIAVLASLLAILTVAYFATAAPPEARERITTAEGGTGRTDIWTVGWRMVEANPIRGAGAGNFEVSSIHYLLEPGALQRDEFIVDTPKVAHNVYLGVLAELGVVGLALFLSLILSLTAVALKAVKEFKRNGDLQMEFLARAHIVAIFGFLASIFFASDEFKKQLWLLLSMAPAMLVIAQASRGSQTGGESGRADD